MQSEKAYPFDWEAVPMTDPASGNFAKAVVERISTVAKERGEKMAQQWGAPLDGKKPTRQQTVELWNLSNPQADPMMVQQLVQQGRHAEAVSLAYPWRLALIGRGDINTRVERANQLAEMAMRAALNEVVDGP